MTNLTLIATIGFNLTTNWTPGYESRTLMWPPEANYSTFTEHGAVYSNEVVRFELYGKAHEITVRSHHILNLGRSYTERTEKVRDYTQQWEIPVTPMCVITNTGTGDVVISNIQNRDLLLQFTNMVEILPPLTNVSRDTVCTNPEPKILTPLDRWNKDAAEARLKMDTYPQPNGIACPTCGNELNDADDLVLTSNPAQRNVSCPKCGYKGTRVY